MPNETVLPVTLPVNVAGHIVAGAGGDDNRLMFYSAPDGGLFPSRQAAEQWAAAHINSYPWMAVSVARPYTPPAASKADVAGLWLTGRGLRIIEKDWTCAEGSIPVIAAEGRTLVAVAITTPFATTRVGIGQRSRLRRLAVQWVVANGVNFDEVRVDRITLTGDGLAVSEYAKGVG
jgi:putative endonuclease